MLSLPEILLLDVWGPFDEAEYFPPSSFFTMMSPRLMRLPVSVMARRLAMPEVMGIALPL
jgi:hypothetical protein